MRKVHPEYIVDDKSNKKAVVIPLSEWEYIVDEIEELDDIRAYDVAKMKTEDSIAFEQAVEEIKSGIVR